jgi:hypothetical protein
VGFDRAGVSAYGTAARATFFVALEQPGPWGRDAATQSHLPAGLGGELAEACASRGGRLSLIRHPGPHADDHGGPGHAAYLAWAGPQPWLLTVSLDDPTDLLRADLDALAHGDRDAVARSMPAAHEADPVLLLCTNGRRDVCCAVRGRPVALDAGAARPGRVWEASHTGGHRFAPTGVLLPHGATLARLDAAQAIDALDQAGSDRLPVVLLGPEHDRGRSALEPGAQAAESHVRAVSGEGSLVDLETTACEPGADGAQRYAVRHRDGRRWLVRVSGADVAALPESCGKPAVPVTAWEPRLVEE